MTDLYRRGREHEDLYQLAELLTEWDEFRSLDLGRLRDLMRRPVLVDGRNILDPEATRAMGFHYAGMGR